MKIFAWLVVQSLVAAIIVLPSAAMLAAEENTLASTDRYRVVVSTDIGGTDPDDFQSMVHLLLYADQLEIEGLISSPYGRGRKQDILKVIDAYEQDYVKLKSYSERYPAPQALRLITKQGEVDEAPYSGLRQSTEGSKWIVECAKRDDPRPLYVLVWGGLEDLAQALHDAPQILPKLRVYWIGGPNKKWSAHAFQYLVDHHPQLWFIEANSTYRGWFVGGDQSHDLGNTNFVNQHIAGHGALGNFFASQLGGIIKMGDTPSVAWLLHGVPSNPARSSWGGQFVRTSARPRLQLDHMPTPQESIEQFAIMELRLPINDDRQPAERSTPVEARLVVENQRLAGFVANDNTLHFRFCPKDQKVYQFTIQSNVPSLNALSGTIKAVAPSVPSSTLDASAGLTHWWTDSLDPALAEGIHYGARSVSRWRAEFLASFAERMRRCRLPKS